MFCQLFSNLIMEKNIELEWLILCQFWECSQIYVFWGEEVSLFFSRKHYLASKLRVWINIICRIYLRINLSSDSGSMIANINYQFLPLCIKEVQDCSRSTNLLESVLQIEICSKKTWIFYWHAEFLSAVRKLILVPECSCLLFVVSCFIDQSFVKTVWFLFISAQENDRDAEVSRGSVLQREVINQSFLTNF